jgi:hypothetical protein
MTGATMRQGPHQAAQKSIRTGSGDFSTSAAKFWSVTISGETSTASGDLHLPQTACRVGSTRFLVPHVGQATIWILAVVLINFSPQTIF